MTGGIAGRTEIRTHPEGRVGCPSSLYKDISALTNTESDHVGVVWHDRHKIVGEDCHVVVINGETLDAFSAAVDEPESVRLAGLKFELGEAGIRRALLGFVGELRAVEAHLAIDQVAIRKRGKRIRRRGHDLVDDRFVWQMKPIAEHDRTYIDVIFHLTWTVDDHRSCDSGRVLSTVVGVPPRCAINVRKEGIGHA